METPFYEKVIIRTEDDLPKEDNLFIWHRKDNGVIDPLQPLFFAKELVPYLLQRFDWYLRPVEQKQPAKTAEEILEEYFPLVIASEDEWAVAVIKAMHEFRNQG